jgi:polysaccharide export outer membrane protein
MWFQFMQDKRFLKSFPLFFPIAILFLSSSCATFQEKFQEVDVEESAVEEEPLQEEPVANESVANEDTLINSPSYLLGPEDIIQVVVWKDDSLTRTVMIRPDGKISLPLIGEVHAAGLTPGDLASGVKNSLQKYYKDQPEVSVIVTEINSFSFFILGEVAIPGKHILRRETTLLQALSLVGGFKEYADTKHILLLRKQGSEEKRININYKTLISGKNPEDNLLLKAGDTIIVP